LSLGAALPARLRALIFLAVVPLGLLFASGLVLRSGSSRALSLVALGLVAGGGLSNWLDRLAHDGLVTDFLSVGFGPVRTGIFNVADVAVVAGVLLLACTRARPSGRAPRGSRGGAKP
jgi:signal peptidase II